MKVDCANLVYGTRFTWAVQDPVPNKKSRIHYVMKLDWFKGQRGDEVRENNGPPCQKSLRSG